MRSSEGRSVSRQRAHPDRRGSSRMHFPRWVLFAAVAFGAMEFTNISLEQFVGLPVPWNAIVPASAMGLIVLTAATVAVRASVMNAVIVVEGGMLLAASGAVLWVALQRSSELTLTLKNAATHLAILPFVDRTRPLAMCRGRRWRKTEGNQRRAAQLAPAAVPGLAVVGLCTRRPSGRFEGRRDEDDGICRRERGWLPGSREW